MWCRISTQWRTGMNGAVGLDYNAMNTVAEIYGLEITPVIFEKIRAIEYYVLEKAQKAASNAS